MSALRIGTRASALARWQAEHVRAALAAAGVDSELVLVRTTGDRDRTTSLRVLGGKGVFVKELEDALLEERIDFAVHSMKDVPTTLPEGLAISAICRRDDVRDALVSRSGAKLTQLPQGARVGTSSLRRQAQLRYTLRRDRPDIELADIRGNVDTRLAKVSSGDYDAVVVAKAGLDRLGLASRISEVLSTEICLPAPGQGAIGVETRANDRAVLDAVRALDDAETRVAVEAERALLAGLGGGCLLPVGAWARLETRASANEQERAKTSATRRRAQQEDEGSGRASEDERSKNDRELILEACVLAIDGSESVRVKRVGTPQNARAMGEEAAAELTERGARQLLETAERSLRHERAGRA